MNTSPRNADRSENNDTQYTKISQDRMTAEWGDSRGSEFRAG
jgi:hypothetical protein